MNVAKEIRSAVDTGEVIMGERETLKLLKDSGLKLVICASNTKAEMRNELEKHAKIVSVPLYNFEGSGLELGAICGRPHLISMLGVINSGDSDILKLGG